MFRVSPVRSVRTHLLLDDRSDPSLLDSTPLDGHGVLQTLTDGFGKPISQAQILLRDGRSGLAFQGMRDGQVDSDGETEQVRRDGRVMM